MIRFGYACICTQLSSQGIRTGRTMIDRKFKAGGMPLASQISLQNAKDLLPILKWNVANGIHLFRIGSEMFPRWNHYEIKDLPDYEEIGRVLQEAGDYARANNIRLTTHPGPFHILGSPDPVVVEKWNVANGIHLFRIGSEMFPRWNHYEIKDLPDYEEIGRVLQEAGDYARANNIRLTTHPGPFHILGSPDPVVVKNSIVGLERHSEMFDMLGYAPSFDNKINIHIGATYNDKRLLLHVGSGTIIDYLNHVVLVLLLRMTTRHPCIQSANYIRWCTVLLVFLLPLTIGIILSIPVT
jgi:UV DNA damage repair endonuclease